MSHDKSIIEQALDMALFGPLGLAVTAKDAFPGWADKGRRRLLHDVEVARIVGEHATRHGHKLVTETLVGLGILPGPPPPATPRPGSPVVGPNVTAAGASTGAGIGVDPTTPTSPASTNGRPTPARPRGAPPPVRAVSDAGPARGSAELAIPGYDSLSASQVVQRLAGLASTELEAVRSYESSGRGRRTILTKISQLQTGRS